MFDVRPTQPDGSLDLEKIQKIQKTVFISERIVAKKPIIYQKFSDIRRATEIFYEQRIEEAPWDDETATSEPGVAEEQLARQANIIQMGQMVSDDLLSVSRVSGQQTFPDYEPDQKTEEFLEDVPDNLATNYFFQSPESFQASLEKSAESLV